MKSHRLIWTLTLLFYLSGCTAYAPLYLPGDQPVPPPLSNESSRPSGLTDKSPGIFPDDIGYSSQPLSSNAPQVVKVGMGVRLTLHNGDTASGRIVKLHDDALVLGNQGHIGMDEEYFAFQDVEKIEKSQGMIFDSFIGVFLVTTFVVLIGVAIAFRTGMSGLN